MAARANIAGLTFGRLKVVSFSHYRGAKRLHKCICNCGKAVFVETGALIRGSTKSCGCLAREKSSAVCFERNTTHGRSGTRTYTIWNDMHRRCYDKRVIGFRLYGARGISVCKRWHKFENFFADMGEAPADLSLERLNRNGNYGPKNCKWATIFEQANNRSNNRILKIFGFKFTLKQASDAFGVPYYRLRSRIQKGWTHETAIIEP